MSTLTIRVGAFLGTALMFTGCASDASEIEAASTPTERKCASRDIPAPEATALEATLEDPVLTDLIQDVQIPVYFHVIRDNNGKGDVSDEALDAQLKVLNAGYGGGTGGAKTAFQFVKAGVDRTNNSKWFTVTPDSAAERAMKTTLRKGGADTLNFYLANIGDGLLGWATFPQDYQSDPKMDGVIVLNASVPGGAAEPFNEGDTGTHEVGHWVGLFHTFQNGCTAPGDLVKDTPRVAEPNFGCPKAIDSCPSGDAEPARADLTNNFMDYVDDPCMDGFTPGQADRAARYWKNFRQGK
jgi:hypothetical protein